MRSSLECAAAGLPYVRPYIRSVGQSWSLAALVLVMLALVWLYRSLTSQCSIYLAQMLGVGFLLVIGLATAGSIVRRPATIVRPINVFFLTCIYLLILDTATLREVRLFNPQNVLIAVTLIGVYLAAVLVAYPFRPLSWSASFRFLRDSDQNLTGSTYFWIAVLIVCSEYFERLYSVGFSVHELLTVMLSAKAIHDPRAGIAFRRGAAGGWDVVFMPIDSLFFGLTAFVDRAWKRGISRPKKLILLLVTSLVLTTIVLGGAKGALIIAVALPLVIRAAQHDKSSGRWIVALIVVSFLTAPVMDTMTQVRGVGWRAIADVHKASWNAVQAPRDDNFHWLVAFVSYLEERPGVLAYKGPLGFADGIRTLSWEWLVSPVPRVLWPGKPKAWERDELGRPWNASESAVGDLLRYGGVTFVVLGGIMMGLWLGALESVYILEKGDGFAIVYGYLLVFTAGLIRSTDPGAAVTALVSCVLISWIWRLFGASFSRSERRPISQPQEAYT